MDSLTVRLHAVHPGGGKLSVNAAVASMAATKMTLRHRGFVHSRSKCAVELMDRLSQRNILLAGVVESCSLLHKDLHESILELDRPIDPTRFAANPSSQDGADVGSSSVSGTIAVCDSEGIVRLFEHAFSQSNVIVKGTSDPARIEDWAREGGLDLVIVDIGIVKPAVINRLQHAGRLDSVVVLATLGTVIDGFESRRIILKPHELFEIKPIVEALLREVCGSDSTAIYSKLHRNPQNEKLIDWYLHELQVVLAELEQVVTSGRIPTGANGIRFMFETGMAYGYPQLSDLAERHLEAKDTGSRVQALRELRALCRRLR